MPVPVNNFNPSDDYHDAAVYHNIYDYTPTVVDVVYYDPPGGPDDDYSAPDYVNLDPVMPDDLPAPDVDFDSTNEYHYTPPPNDTDNRRPF